MRKDRPITSAGRIAEKLDISERTVRRWAKNGRLPTYKLGGITSPLRVDRNTVEKLKSGLGSDSTGDERTKRGR
jgi:excisionase family DNA binding protein